MDNGTWEKPSKGEGNKIKLNLGEQILVTKLLTGELQKWNTVHSFKDQTTPIIDNRAENGQIWIRAGKYRKRLSSLETDILLLMMEHIIQEKIENATGATEKVAKSDKIVKMKSQMEALVSS